MVDCLRTPSYGTSAGWHLQAARLPEGKLLPLDEVIGIRKRLKEEGRTVVFTNGCFDILHAGHVRYLNFARGQGDVLIVGLNSDASVRRNKGPERPINSQENRALVLAALEAVDFVIIFDEPEPAPLIERLLPDVLVKGEDWAHYVSGREVVERHGGKVILAPLVQGLSTTNILKRIQSGNQKGA